MGAWGTGTFENDNAIDWLAELASDEAGELAWTPAVRDLRHRLATIAHVLLVALAVPTSGDRHIDGIDGCNRARTKALTYRQGPDPFVTMVHLTAPG